MTSSAFPAGFGKSDFGDPTTMPAFWSASEYSALHETSHAVRWEPARRPSDRRTNWALVSVLVMTASVIASAALLAMNS